MALELLTLHYKAPKPAQPVIDFKFGSRAVSGLADGKTAKVVGDRAALPPLPPGVTVEPEKKPEPIKKAKPPKFKAERAEAKE